MVTRTPLDDLADAQRELLDAESELLNQIAQKLVFMDGFMRGADRRMEALEKRVYKLEDVVNEILRRTAGFGVRVMEGENRAERVREGEQKREGAVGAPLDLGASERSNT